MALLRLVIRDSACKMEGEAVLLFSKEASLLRSDGLTCLVDELFDSHVFDIDQYVEVQTRADEEWEVRFVKFIMLNDEVFEDVSLEYGRDYFDWLPPLNQHDVCWLEADDDLGRAIFIQLGNLLVVKHHGLLFGLWLLKVTIDRQICSYYPNLVRFSFLIELTLEMLPIDDLLAIHVKIDQEAFFSEA